MKEIERKFLLAEGASIPIPAKFEKFKIKQAYIFADKDKQVRIRLTKTKAVLCVKYTEGLVRDEFEYEIPLKDGKMMYDKSNTKLEKKRLSFKLGSEHYDVDTYPNGYIVLEVEFKDEQTLNNWVKPNWIGEEITQDSKYSNIVLAQQNLKF
jgi:CYTH domain-containing protein